MDAKRQEQVLPADFSMPSHVDVSVTIREDGSVDGLPVVHLTLTDAAGEQRDLDLDEGTCDRLSADLARAGRQLRRGDVHRPTMQP
jgi:hypothetical protein